MISDSPSARSDRTGMRDFLRALDRERTASKPARPNPRTPTPVAPRAAATTVTVGDWVLSQDSTGDLIATHSDTGAIAVLARKETS